MWKALVAAALALVLLLGMAVPVLADYTTDDGYTVHWAGGTNIVVTDSSGNVVYEGSGTLTQDSQGNDRLIWDGTSNQGSGSGSRVRDSVTQDELERHPSETIGLGGSRPGGERGSSSSSGSSGAQQSTASTNPYSHLGMTYAGMQPVSVTLSDGQEMTGYANCYEVWDPVQQRSIAYSAIPASSDIGRQLADAGFQVSGGWVLIHYGASGATVGWTPGETGPSFSMVSARPDEPNPLGGQINITLPSSGRSSSSGSSGGGSYTPPPSSYVLSPDTRKLAGYPELPVVKVGGMVPLVAEVTGICRQVTAFAGWGGSAVLEPSADGKFRGVLQVPVNARPGVYPLVFEAVVGQVGYADRLFTVSGVLTVQAQGGGDGGPVPPAPGEEPDWWTPPEYQSP
ncbi:MAG: hypothetical protein H5U04_03500 [Firmicutes bacterium]|nr:hypothetical protein [Bacillota bacterium]